MFRNDMMTSVIVPGIRHGSLYRHATGLFHGVSPQRHQGRRDNDVQIQQMRNVRLGMFPHKCPRSEIDAQDTTFLDLGHVFAQERCVVWSWNVGSTLPHHDPSMPDVFGCSQIRKCNVIRLHHWLDEAVVHARLRCFDVWRVCGSPLG